MLGQTGDRPISHVLRIHDPWQLELSIGNEEFPATLIGIIPGPDLPDWQRKHLLLEPREPFLCEKEPVSQLLCAPRYQGDPMLFARHLSCTVGICRVRPGIVYDKDSRIAPEDVHYFAIGEIRAINPLNNFAESIGRIARRTTRRDKS